MPTKKELETALTKAEKDLMDFKSDLRKEINHTQKKFYEGMISSTETLIRALKKRIRELK